MLAGLTGWFESKVPAAAWNTGLRLSADGVVEFVFDLLKHLGFWLFLSIVHSPFVGCQVFLKGEVITM